MTQSIKNVLFVCTGNICRSPTGHGVMKHIAQNMGVNITIESCGTAPYGSGSYHLGESPDSRSQKHAVKRGYDLSHIRASYIQDSDFETYDLILCMDSGHLQELKTRFPHHGQNNVTLFTSIFNDHRKNTDVPDPYYGGADGFELVLDLIEDGCKKWLDKIK